MKAKGKKKHIYLHSPNCLSKYAYPHILYSPLVKTTKPCRTDLSRHRDSHVGPYNLEDNTGDFPWGSLRRCSGCMLDTVHAFDISSRVGLSRLVYINLSWGEI